MDMRIVVENPCEKRKFSLSSFSGI